MSFNEYLLKYYGIEKKGNDYVQKCRYDFCVVKSGQLLILKRMYKDRLKNENI